jgi:hypothetical protein
MSTFQKTLIAVAIVAAIGTAALYEAGQNRQLRRQNEALQEHAPAGDASRDATLQDQIGQLAQQNRDLTDRLAKANASASQLAEAKQQAVHLAGLYRQLADQAAAKNTASTNDYPTPRHVFAGFGRLTRQIVELNSQDESQLSADEKAAMDEKRASLMRSFMDLAALAGQYDRSQPAGANSPDQAADGDPGNRAADTMTCLLFGAMDLTEPQFNQAYSILQKYQQQATAQDLFNDSSTPEMQSALKQLNGAASKDIESLLTGDQAQAFEGLLPCIQLISRSLNITFTK